MHTGNYTNFSNATGVILNDSSFFVDNSKQKNNPYFYTTKTHFSTPKFHVSSFPFGVELDQRHGAEDERYRYGFQGQEGDDEIKGEGNSSNYKYRMSDPRIGRFFAIDPLSPKYPELTPYQFSSNSPIYMSEIEGLEGQPNSNSEAEKAAAEHMIQYLQSRIDANNGAIAKETQELNNNNKITAQKTAELSGAYKNMLRLESEQSVIKLQITTMWEKFAVVQHNAEEISNYFYWKNDPNTNQESITYESYGIVSSFAELVELEATNEGSSSGSVMPTSQMHTGSCYGTSILAPVFTEAQIGVSNGLQYAGMSESSADNVSGVIVFFGSVYLGAKAPVIVNKTVGYTGLAYNKIGYKIMGESFYKLHPRITNIGPRGYGHGQADVYHRTATFYRSEMLETGKFGVRNWNTIYTNYKLGDHNYSIGINPWTRTIFHEGPSIMK